MDPDPRYMFSVMKTEKKCNTRTTVWGDTYKCRGILAGLIQKKEDKIHLKLNTIKSVKACDAFPFSKKIIRVSYCAIAYMHTSLFLFPSCRHDSFRFSPSFFSFTTFYNLTLCFCTVKVNVKAHANWRNIVFSQQLPTLLDATCFVRLHTLLHVVACCWELLHPFAHQCPTMLGVVASACT